MYAPTALRFKAPLYKFPIAAVTNYHRHSGLKRHKFTTLQFWGPEVQNGSSWTKIKG